MVDCEYDDDGPDDEDDVFSWPWDDDEYREDVDNA